MGGQSKIGLNRIKKEYIAIQKDATLTNLIIVPNPKDFYEWHYVVYGLKDCPYEGGVYHGKLLLPSEYPTKPPGIVMLTPNGRFKTNTRICLSMSDFHPETWSPSWNISSVLVGLVSFMITDEITTGCERRSDEERRKYAAQSFAYNMNTPMFVNLFKESFDKFEETKENISKEKVEKISQLKNSVRNEQGGIPPQPVRNDGQNNNPSIFSIVILMLLMFVIFKVFN